MIFFIVIKLEYLIFLIYSITDKIYRKIRTFLSVSHYWNFINTKENSFFFMIFLYILHHIEELFRKFILQQGLFILSFILFSLRDMQLMIQRDARIV